MEPDCPISFKTLLEMMRIVLEEKRTQFELFMMPIRAIASAFGCDIEGDSKKEPTKTACNIKSKTEKEMDNAFMLDDMRRRAEQRRLKGK